MLFSDQEDFYAAMEWYEKFGDAWRQVCCRCYELKRADIAAISDGRASKSVYCGADDQL